MQARSRHRKGADIYIVCIPKWIRHVRGNTVQIQPSIAHALFLKNHIASPVDDVYLLLVTNTRPSSEL